MYEVGDDVVCGLYYQKKGKDYYVLLNDSYLVNCHFYLIRVIKFLTPPNDHQVPENNLVHKLLDGAYHAKIEMVASLESKKWAPIGIY